VSTDRKYRLEPGVQQTLKAVLPTLPDLLDDWKGQVESGVVDEQLRQLAVALGWVTSRDSRVRVTQGLPSSTVRRRRATPSVTVGTVQPVGGPYSEDAVLVPDAADLPPGEQADDRRHPLLSPVVEESGAQEMIDRQEAPFPDVVGDTTETAEKPGGVLPF
jgi:hypothetical protein